MRANKKIKRRGYYCTKEKKNCEDAYILINSYKGCEGGIRCDCPKCQYSERIVEEPEQTGMTVPFFRAIPGGFEVVRTALRAEKDE
jgi:hypothetical protein